jgi:hypothetical protein
MPKAFATIRHMPVATVPSETLNLVMAADYSVREDSGNDHSNEKPNFDAGVEGGCG